MNPRGLLLTLVTAICGGIGISLMKFGLAAQPMHLLAFMGGLAAYGAGILGGIALLALYPISLAYPMVVGSSIAVLAAISAVWLNESLTPLRIAGIALVIIGVALLVGRPAAAREK